MPRFLHVAVWLMLPGILLGQATPAKKPAENTPESTTEPVAPDDLVILIPGACKTQPLEFAVRDCIRGVTREQFEQLAAATGANRNPESRRKLAQILGQVIIFSNEAKKRNLPKDPGVKELLQFAQLQELANLLISRSIKKDAANVSEAEIEDYYRLHSRDYQTAELLRVSIPLSDGAYVEALRIRCASGEDPSKLQTEANQRAGQNAMSPVDLKNQRRVMFPAVQQTVFDLKPGECAVVSTDKTGFFLYKMVATMTAPLNDERNAIVSVLETAKVKQELDALRKQNVISLNGKYFNAEGAARATPVKPQDAGPK